MYIYNCSILGVHLLLKVCWDISWHVCMSGVIIMFLTSTWCISTGVGPPSRLRQAVSQASGHESNGPTPAKRSRGSVGSASNLFQSPLNGSMGKLSESDPSLTPTRTSLRIASMTTVVSDDGRKRLRKTWFKITFWRHQYFPRCIAYEGDIHTEARLKFQASEEFSGWKNRMFLLNVRLVMCLLF